MTPKEIAHSIATIEDAESSLAKMNYSAGRLSRMYDEAEREAIEILKMTEAQKENEKLSEYSN